MPIIVTLSHDLETLVSLQDEWIDLQTRSCAQSMELTWQGIHIYHKHHIGQLWIMTAREDDRLIGIAPLIKVEVKPVRGFARQEIEFIGAAIDQEHLDFIIEPGYEEQVISLFIDKLYEHKSQWDVISLTGLCDTKTLDILKHSHHDWIDNPQKNMIAPYMTLPDTVDEWMQSISRNHRQKLRRNRRKLDEQFPERWTIIQVTTSDELNETFIHLVRLHQTHWKAMGEPGTFHNADQKAYYHELMHSMLENDWLRLYRLDIDNMPCAVYYCYHYLGRAYFQIVGVDRDVTDIPLGYILLEHSIMQAIQEGCHEFTFMWGEQSYKYSFGGVNRVHHALRLIGNPRLRLQVKSINLLRRIKSRIHIRSRINQVKSRILMVESTTNENNKE